MRKSFFTHFYPSQRIVLWVAVLSLWQLQVSGMQASEQDTIAVICLNDFHGSFVQTNDVPGAGNVYSHIKRLQGRYPSHVTLATGDNFGGSYFSNLTQGKLIPFFFSRVGISISAVGNHEFDNGQSFLQTHWRDTLNYVCANLTDSVSGILPGYVIPMTVVNVTMPDSLVSKLGIIGLIASSAKYQTKKENVTGLSFDSTYHRIIQAKSDQLKQKGVDWQMLLAHIGTGEKNALPQWEDNYSSELKKLPAQILGIASGHSHKRVCGRIDDVPVVQGGISGKFIGVLRFLYDRSTRKLTAIDPLVVSVNPLQDTSLGRKEIDDAVEQIYADTEITSIGLKLKDEIAVVDSCLVHDRNNNRITTMLGTYVCMSYADAYRRAKNLTEDDIVLGFSHFGSLRRSLPAGSIDVLAAGEVLPFSNRLKVYQMKGKDIYKAIEAGLENPRGFMQMNNLIVDTLYSLSTRGIRVLNVYYHIPGKKVIALSKNKVYPVVVDEYITTGGDGYPVWMFPEREYDASVTTLETTNSFLKFLKKLYDAGSHLTPASPYKAKLKYYNNDL